ncbi:MAG TPA: 2-oxoacid:acceptor oxidoreductase family protein [Candidatus Nanopelagicaceae bacterium]|nr:2-oxoacid:acceptor oxidoreductase family protein [Candidatus Nanopelagicaceae bacterium]
MKLKLRFSGRGGQGIKSLGSVLVRVATAANYYATLTVDYTPSVRGGPIFCDVIISSAPISYPFCDKDADIFIAIDQTGFKRASECIYEKTLSFIDEHTIINAEEIIQKGKIHRVPITRRADEKKIPKSANILCLGFLSQYLKESRKIDLKEDYFDQVLNSMPKRFREVNIQSYQLGQALYQELINKSQ